MAETPVEVGGGVLHDPVQELVHPPQQMLLEEVSDGGDHRGLRICVSSFDGVETQQAQVRDEGQLEPDVVVRLGAEGGCLDAEPLVESPDVAGLLLEGEVLIAEIDRLVGAGQDMVRPLEQVTMVDDELAEGFRRASPQGIESANRLLVRCQRPVAQDGTVPKRRGQGLVEYALIIAVVSIALVVALSKLSGPTSPFTSFVTRVTSCLSAGGTCT